jgi:hypothetical protein
MTHPEAAAPPPLKGRPQWPGKAGSTGPLGLGGSCDGVARNAMDN